MPYTLDSSAFFEILRNTPKGSAIIAFLGDETLHLTSVTIYEILAGIKPSENEMLVKKLENVSVLNFDKVSAEKTAEIEKELKESGKMINKLDIFIAGICKSNGMTVVTLDRDFEKVKDLNVKVIR